MLFSMLYPKIKVIYPFLLSMIFVYTSKLNAAEPNFKIIGFSNDMMGEQLILNYGDKFGRLQSDTTTITDHGFEFKGEIPHSTMMQITLSKGKLKDEKETRIFFVDIGVVHLELSYNNFYAPNIWGSKTDSSFVSFYFQNDSLQKKIYDMMVTLRHINQDSASELEKEIAILKSKKKQNSINFIQYNTNSVAAAYVLMSKIYDWDDSTLQALYYPLKWNVKNTSYGKLVDKRLQVSTGKIAPLFEALTFENKQFSLLKQLKSSKLVMLVFWASWCKPCRQEIPYLKDLFARYSSKGLAVVGIATQDKNDNWKKAIDTDQSTAFIHILDKYTDSTSIDALYSVMPIPTIIVIDEAGTIIYRQLEGNLSELEKLIQQYFLVNE